MARWRYVDEVHVEVAKANRPSVPSGDELLDIYEVIEGAVMQLQDDGEGEGFTLPPGSFIRLLEEDTEEDWVYRSVALKLKMNDMEVGLKDGSLVAFLPANYREVADGA